MAKPSQQPKAMQRKAIQPKAIPLEIDIQAAFRKRLYYGAPKVKVVAVPNGYNRTPWQRRQGAKEGISSGFPDVLCVWPSAGIAFIEFKRPGGATSENQSEWHDRLHRYGHRIFVAYGVDEAVDFLRRCGAPIAEQPSLVPAVERLARQTTLSLIADPAISVATRKARIMFARESGDIDDAMCGDLIAIHGLRDA